MSETSPLFRDGVFHHGRCPLPEQRSGSEKAVREDVRGPHAGFGARSPAQHTALTRGREQQRAVLAVQVLHGRDPGVPRVPVVEVVQLLPFLPVPETSGKERSVVREMQTKATGRSPSRLPGRPLSRRAMSSGRMWTSSPSAQGGLSRGCHGARSPTAGCAETSSAHGQATNGGTTVRMTQVQSERARVSGRPRAHEQHRVSQS